MKTASVEHRVQTVSAFVTSGAVGRSASTKRSSNKLGKDPLKTSILKSAIKCAKSDNEQTACMNDTNKIIQPLETKCIKSTGVFKAPRFDNLREKQVGRKFDWNVSKKKKRVTFGDVTTFEFPIIHGGSSVPSIVAAPLGLARRHQRVTKCTVETHERSEQHNRSMTGYTAYEAFVLLQKSKLYKDHEIKQFMKEVYTILQSRECCNNGTRPCPPIWNISTNYSKK